MTLTFNTVNQSLAHPLNPYPPMEQATHTLITVDENPTKANVETLARHLKLHK